MKTMFWAKVKAAAAVAAVTVLGGGFVIHELAAGEPADKAERKGPLAALPSAPGAHIEKIKALGDNSWLMLPPVAPDPKWGEARGRAWGGRSMTYAPDLGGAFFCGEGQHGFVKPDGHYMDDLWFYDANAHVWICLHPGADTKSLKLTLDKNGFEFDADGNYVPVAYLGHAFGHTTYDPDHRKYAVIPIGNTWWPVAMPHRGEWLGIPPEDRGKPYKTGRLNIDWAKHPLFYDVAAGKWERRFVEGPGGPPERPKGVSDGLAQYIPSMKKLFYARGEKVWFFDYATYRWSGPEGSGNPGKAPGNGYENGCYDPKRERVYVGGAKAFGYYDLKVRQWTLVRAEGQPEDFKSTNSRCLAYDTANDALLYCENRFLGKERRAPVMAAYLPGENKWVSLPEAPSFPMASIPDKFTQANGLQGLLHGFYHSALNAHFYFLSGDSGTGGAMLAYRYKRPKS